MINVNTEFFKRTQPQKKLQIIEKLTSQELLAITKLTIARIIREAGTGKRNNKDLNLSRINRTGNSWNSTIESWYMYKGKIYIDFYLQYENTDCNTGDSASSFLRRGEYQGSVERDDRYGNPRHYYFTYDEGDKARAIRALLREYIETKYHDKLNNNNEK